MCLTTIRGKPRLSLRNSKTLLFLLSLFAAPYVGAQGAEGGSGGGSGSVVRSLSGKVAGSLSPIGSESGANGMIPPATQVKERSQALSDLARKAWDSGRPGDARRLMVAAAAIQAIGRPYLWGAAPASLGYDCSRLVQFAFERAGLKVPRTTREQIRVGLNVPNDMSQIAWGDLLFFNDGANNGVSHVGIAIGDAMFVHASSHYGQVVVSEMRGVYLRRWIGTKRLIGDS